MKKLFVFCISMALMSYSISAAPEAGFSQNDSLIILSTPGLNDLALKWAGEYNKAFPGEKIKVRSIPVSGISEDMLRAGNIAILSGKDMGRATETALKITIARDVIVPVINSGNPYISEISSKGISAATLASVCSNDGPSKWNDILHGNQDRQVTFYFPDDPAIMDGIEAFLGIDESKIKGKMAENSAELLSAIKNDPYSIGFCRLINIQNTEFYARESS
jgi:ABC-type phosphate transport system substrate-binding protein